jgi:hypothetical protein
MSEHDNIAILIGNLPSEISEDDIVDALESLDCEMEVSLSREGDADRVTAVVRFAGMTRASAEKLAAQIRTIPWRGRLLNAYVPMFFK